MTTPELILATALLLFGLFCFGGMWAGVEKNGNEFRIGSVE